MWGTEGIAPCIFICHYAEAPSSGRITSKESYPMPTKQEVQWAPKPVLTLQTTERLRPEGWFRNYGRALYQLRYRGPYTPLTNLQGVYIEKPQFTMECSKRQEQKMLPTFLWSVIPVAYITTILYQWSKNSSQKHIYICMYNSVPTTCFGRFLTGHHQVGYNVGGTTYLLKYSHWWPAAATSFKSDYHTATTTDYRLLWHPGHPRTPMTPLGKTQPTNNEHTMHALLL